MSEKPLFDLERKVAEWIQGVKKGGHEPSARERGALGLTWQQTPLRVKEEPVSDSAQKWKERLEKSRR